MTPAAIAPIVLTMEDYRKDEKFILGLLKRKLPDR